MVSELAQHSHCANFDCKRRRIPGTTAQIGMEKISRHLACLIRDAFATRV